MLKKVKVSELKSNPNNPRLIKDDKFRKLVKSIQDFPEMLEARPIVVNKEMIVLGGNMRLKALQEAQVKEVTIDVRDWTEEQQKEFIIKDNVGFGTWDWDTLANEWDNVKLEEWGLDIIGFNTDNFQPNITPETNYSDVTKEQIQKEAEKLANAMLQTEKKIECICPECGTEFEIDNLWKK